MSKRARPIDPDAEDNRDNEDYYYEDVDERNNPTNDAPVVPPGFLSPSVREYLDLGKSIPGKQDLLYETLFLHDQSLILFPLFFPFSIFVFLMFSNTFLLFNAVFSVTSLF